MMFFSIGGLCSHIHILNIRAYSMTIVSIAGKFDISHGNRHKFNLVLRVCVPQHLDLILLRLEQIDQLIGAVRFYSPASTGYL